jgi:hypothetical protein
MDIETSHIFVCPNCHERLSVTPEYREGIRWLWLVGFAVLLVVGMSTGELNVNAAGWFFASILIMFVATLVLEFIFPPNLARDSTESDVISLDLFPRKRHKIFRLFLLQMNLLQTSQTVPLATVLNDAAH